MTEPSAVEDSQGEAEYKMGLCAQRRLMTELKGKHFLI